MPPVTKAGGDAFEKQVEFVAKDDAEQKAVGIVMVPDKADLQHDFAREDTIRSFASQFKTFEEAGEADGGIMHAAWPSDWMILERNEVLEESENINGTTAPAGAWIQTWQFNDAETWSLVEDGILEGYSIGAVDVDWDGPYAVGEDDAVDDVAVPEQLPDDAMVWELTDGIIREVSAVDIPAVPDAEILEAKAAEKRLSEHLGSRDDFVDEAMDRGHTETEAERLWEVLNRAVDVEGAGDPGKDSMFARAGKAFLSALSPGGDLGSDDDATRATGSEAPDSKTASDAEDHTLGPTTGLEIATNRSLDEGELYCAPSGDVYDDVTLAAEIDCPGCSRTLSGVDLMGDISASAKAGRTLSEENRKSIMAQIDAGLDVLQDAGVDHEMTRFTDRDDVDFDLSEHDARAWSTDGDDDGGDQDLPFEVDNHAPDGDTSDDSTTDMSDNPDDKDGDADKSLPEQNAEQINELTDAVKTLTDAVQDDSSGEGDGAEKQTAEVELPDGSVAEVSKDEVLEWFEDDGDAGVDDDGVVPATKSDVEALHDRLDSIARQSGGHSQQLDSAGGSSDGGDDGEKLSEIGEALS